MMMIKISMRRMQKMIQEVNLNHLDIRILNWKNLISIGVTRISRKRRSSRKGILLKDRSNGIWIAWYHQPTLSINQIAIWKVFLASTNSKTNLVLRRTSVPTNNNKVSHRVLNSSIKTTSSKKVGRFNRISNKTSSNNWILNKMILKICCNRTKNWKPKICRKKAIFIKTRHYRLWIWMIKRRCMIERRKRC